MGKIIEKVRKRQAVATWNLLHEWLTESERQQAERIKQPQAYIVRMPEPERPWWKFWA